MTRQNQNSVMTMTSPRRDINILALLLLLQVYDTVKTAFPALGMFPSFSLETMMQVSATTTHRSRNNVPVDILQS